jgi:hypothetical protein
LASNSLWAILVLLSKTRITSCATFEFFYASSNNFSKCEVLKIFFFKGIWEGFQSNLQWCMNRCSVMRWSNRMGRFLIIFCANFVSNVRPYLYLFQEELDATFGLSIWFSMVSCRECLYSSVRSESKLFYLYYINDVLTL